MEQTLSCVINPLNVMGMVHPACVKEGYPFLNAFLVMSRRDLSSSRCMCSTDSLLYIL